MLEMIRTKQQLLAGVAIGLVFTAILIYTTPLKNLNLLEPKIDDIAPKEFHDLFSANPEKYLFLDVRSPTEYFKEHAQGAINIPINVLYFEKDVLPKSGKTIVLVCTGGALSGVAYHYLEHHGFLNLRRIDGGIRAWNMDNLPVLKESWK